MLQKASVRCSEALHGLPAGQRAAGASFDVWDMAGGGGGKKGGQQQQQPEAVVVDAVVCALGVENVSLEVFFRVVGGMVKKKAGGMVLVTGMHPDVGRDQQAGLRGEGKGKGGGYVHDVEGVVEMGRGCGWRVKFGPEVREVREEDVGRFGERARKWVGRKVWFGMVLERG